MTKGKTKKLKKENASLAEDVLDSKNLAAEIVKSISLHMIDTFPDVPADYTPPKCVYKKCTNAMRHIKARIEAYMEKYGRQVTVASCEHCGVKSFNLKLLWPT